MAVPSVSTAVRLPVKLYERLRQEALRRQVPMTQVIVEALEKELLRKEEAGSDHQRD